MGEESREGAQGSQSKLYEAGEEKIDNIFKLDIK
jgi:hypothetical protein